MNIAILKKYFKNILRVVPAPVYGRIFIVYNKYILKNTNVEYLKKVSAFNKAGFYDFKLDSLSFPIFLDPGNGCVDYSIVSRGSFESNILRFIKGEITSAESFIDIGANIGQHSLYISNYCKKFYLLSR